MPKRYPPIPINELGFKWEYSKGDWSAVLVREPKPRWVAPEISSAGRVAGCCGSSVFNFRYGEPRAGTYATAADEYLGLGPTRVKFVTCTNDTEEYNAWLREWLQVWHDNRSTRTYMLATLLEKQARAWLPFLEPHGWKIIAKHRNGNTGNMLYIIARTNVEGTELGTTN